RAISYLRKIEKAVSCTTDLIITYHSIGPSQTEVMNFVFQRFPEFLVRYGPGQACGGEKSETMTFMKTFGTIVPEVKFRIVSTVVRIGSSSRKSHVTEWQRQL